MHRLEITKSIFTISYKAVFITISLVVLHLFNISKIDAQVYIGAKAGARTSWLQYDDFASEDYDKSLFYGYSAGFTGAVKVQKRFTLQLDIMYAQNGKKIDGITDASLQNYAKYHFINTPVVYKLDFNGSLGARSFKWYVGAGPNVNFWLGGKGILKSVELQEESLQELQYQIIFDSKPASPKFGGLYYEEFNRVQVGLIVSTGLVVEPVPGQSLIIDFRYEWGHSYMANEKGRFTNVIAYQDDLRARNQAIQISVAYMFDIINKGKKEKKLYYKN
ncbi:outer membrane beta-barrel protein [Marivirga harenae]|uniref:outer membrane beta-barrel protein n=1 Tax=Marivirga harenae TaxID=2010992 RepID=UPI0026DF8E64|nr:outer membrane beta-barrel protein [Marivirga harenae]WKV10630.1 outer membrane beta-barrel protein [Marivirga harenae]|tara:strand:- start:609096 stop:609923 length:828 start_codon:yes stop_codon:yes gene_type:complete